MEIRISGSVVKKVEMEIKQEQRTIVEVACIDRPER